MQHTIDRAWIQVPSNTTPPLKVIVLDSYWWSSRNIERVEIHIHKGKTERLRSYLSYIYNVLLVARCSPNIQIDKIRPTIKSNSKKRWIAYENQTTDIEGNTRAQTQKCLNQKNNTCIWLKHLIYKLKS